MEIQVYMLHSTDLVIIGVLILTRQCLVEQSFYKPRLPLTPFHHLHIINITSTKQLAMDT